MAETKGKFPNYLQWALDKAGVEVSDLARAIDTAPQNIYRLRDEERELTGSWATKLAQGLPGIQAAELIFGPIGTHSPLSVGVFSTIAAGRFAEARVITEEDGPEKTVTEDLPPGDWLAFEVIGDSMNHIAAEGSIVFVNRKARELEPGRVFAVAIGGDATFKRYKSPPPRFEPMSTNPAHETIFIETPDEVRVIGRVERVVFNLV